MRSEHLADLSMREPLVEITACPARRRGFWPMPKIGAALAMSLSKARRLYRGCNQADDLAARLAQHHGWPLSSAARYRVQSGITHRKARSKAMSANAMCRHAFAVQSGLVKKNCNLLLIDDAVTTGATLNELARVLKKGGAGRLFCWTLATRANENFLTHLPASGHSALQIE